MLSLEKACTEEEADLFCLTCLAEAAMPSWEETEQKGGKSFTSGLSTARVSFLQDKDLGTHTDCTALFLTVQNLPIVATPAAK